MKGRPNVDKDVEKRILGADMRRRYLLSRASKYRLQVLRTIARLQRKVEEAQKCEREARLFTWQRIAKENRVSVRTIARIVTTTRGGLKRGRRKGATEQRDDAQGSGGIAELVDRDIRSPSGPTEADTGGTAGVAGMDSHEG